MNERVMVGVRPITVAGSKAHVSESSAAVGISAISLSASLSRRGGGLFDASRGLCQAVNAVGVSIEAFGLEDKCTVDDRPKWKGVRTQVFRIIGPRSIGCSPKLARALVASNPSLVHQHGLWTYPSVACTNWAKSTKQSYVISPHGMLDPWALANSQWKKRLAAWLFQNAHLRGAACLHALCESEAASIRAYGLRNPICVIPNGIDIPGHRGQQASPWADAGSWGKTLLFLGRIHPKKGLPELMNGWAEAARRDPVAVREWMLVIAGWGQGGHEDELKRQVCELGINDSMRFVGPLFDEHKAAALEHADAFVLPSVSEGLPMAVLEAWAYGLPVLMTPECNLPSGFDVGAAMRIESQSASIANGLNELWGMSDAERQTMGELGRALVAERFTWAMAAGQMKSVYEWVLGRGERPECVRLG